MFSFFDYLPTKYEANPREWKIRKFIWGFKDGKFTGRTISADITYMLQDYTGLAEGYCILGIEVTGHTGDMSETDTKIPGQLSFGMNPPEEA